MTEKRFRTGKGIFEEGYPSETIIDNKTKKTYYKGYDNYISSKEICKILNELYEENKQLKQKVDFYKYFQKDARELEKENEELKQIIYEDESQIIGEWSSHIQEDMKKLNKAYESDDINDLIRFCKEG